MKSFLALVVLASTATSFAASRDIYDIMYLPTAGTSYGFTELDYFTGDYKSSGTKVDLDGYRVTQTLGHAFSDSLSFQGSLNYLSQKNDAGSAGDFKTSGVSDPSFQLKYRVSDSDFRWDVIAGTTLGVQDAEVEADQDTTNSDGAIKLSLGTQIGGKAANFQWAALASLQHYFPGHIEVAGTASKTDAYNDLLLRVDGLYKLAESSIVRGFVGSTIAQGTENDVVGDIASSTVYNAGAEYQHVCSANLLARIGVDYTIRNQDSGTTKDYDFVNLRIGANYQF